MIYRYEKIKPKNFQIDWASISKFIFFCFLLYIDWYKEIWGDVPVILYGSVIALTFSSVLAYNGKYKSIGFDCMIDFFIVLLVFGIYSFFSGIIVSIDRSLFISSMLTFFSFLVVLFDCCMISRRDNSWEWLLDVLLCVSLICCVYSLLLGVVRQNGGAGAYTLSSTNNPHTLGMVFLCGIFALLANRKTGFQHFWIKLFILLILCYAILRTGSRKILLSTVFFLCIWIIYLIKYIRSLPSLKSRCFLMMFIFVSMLFVIWFIRKYYIGTDQFERLMRIFNNEEDSSNENRIQMYLIAWELLKEHPLFGVGFNQYKLYSIFDAYSHSTYAEVFSCTGLIGGGILFIPILVLLCSSIKRLSFVPKEYGYYYAICIAGLFIELFLGFGQIWIYGLAHELFLLCIFGVLDDCDKLEIPVSTANIYEDRVQCKYLR